MESVLLSARCTANTATVFWNKPENATADTVYEVSLDGGHSVHTNRTHYTFTELIPNTEYCVTVYSIGSIHICTLPARRRIYVTEEPYNAVGDGKTLNTARSNRLLQTVGQMTKYTFLPESI